MAIQFARTAYVTRSSGGNACLKSSYNGRSEVNCERTGQVFNFKARGGNVHHEVLLPDHVDASFKNSTVLWNACEKIENRKNSQVAKEIVLALPDNKEVTFDHRVELTQTFIQEHFVSKGLAAQIDVHAPHEGEKNWHGHVLVTTRRFKENGLELGQKARDLNQQVRLGKVVEGWDIGEAWKEHQNAFFIEKGLDLKVDPIGLVTQEHLGPVRMRAHMSEAMERAYLLQQANEEASKDPEQVLKSLTKHQSVFQLSDVDRYLNKHVSPQEISQVRDAILSSQNLLALYDPNTGDETPYFTTQVVRDEEQKLLRSAQQVNRYGCKTVSQQTAEAVIQQKGLYAEQEAAAIHALSPDKGLAIVEGKAGTGKSYTMQAIKEIYETSKYRVIGLAPTNQVSQDMQKDGFQEGHTLHSFLFKHKNNRISVNHKTVLVVDEAAMVSNSVLVELFHIAKEAKCKVILFGDDRQLMSVERGGMFRPLIDQVGSCELSEVMRQQGWQKDVSELLSNNRTREAAYKLFDQGAVSWDKTKEVSMTSLVQAWVKDREANPDQNQLILANKNVDVDTFNKAIRQVRRDKGEIDLKEYSYQTARGVEQFSQKDRVCFTETDKGLGIFNSSFGTIQELSDKHCVVELDKGQVVTFDPTAYQGMKLGYASTVYKSQGKTINCVYILHDKGTDKRLSYVSLTRQNINLNIFANREETRDLHHFAYQIGKVNRRVPSLTYVTAEDIRKAQVQGQNVSYIESMKGLWQGMKVSLKDKFHHNAAFYKIQAKSKPQAHTVKGSQQKVNNQAQGSQSLKQTVQTVSQAQQPQQQATLQQVQTPQVAGSSSFVRVLQNKPVSVAAPVSLNSSTLQNKSTPLSVPASQVTQQQTPSVAAPQAGQHLQKGGSIKVSIPKVASQGSQPTPALSALTISSSTVTQKVQKKAEAVLSAPEVLPQNDKERENLPHDHILTNVDKNTAIVAKVEAPSVTQELQPQTAQTGEGQERQDDQPKVMVEKDRTEIAATPNAASTQESAAHASGVESSRSATETTPIESQKEVTLEKAPAVLSPKQQALNQDYEKIRNYLTIQGDDVSILEQHYRNDPDHAISFYKGLFERHKSFAQHMAQADKIAPITQKETTLEKPPAVLTPKQQALHQDYEKIRNYLTIQGDDVSIIDQHYRNDPDHAISFYKGLFERHKSFAQHMARPDAQSASTTEIASAPISNVTKADDLIEKIQKAEGIYLNFREPMKLRTEAREQLKELYTEASKNSVVMDKLKESDPKLQARIQEHVQPQKSRSFGLEI